MAGSLLILLDDIAAVLDDVAVMTKVATKKTAGVLGDDLALNAQQVTGVQAARELPVVWAVAKGSFVNKLILVPAALAISAVAPALITPLLMLGGAFLCYEGAEKVVHKLAPQWLPHEDNGHEQAHVLANASQADLVALEKDKIHGAIRTDFILSAEIVVISLGVMTQSTLLTKTLSLSIIAVVMTVGVYGLVAGIVKLDDLGLHWLKNNNPTKQKLGQAILAFAPKLMKFLSVAGTAAMFLVGGGIVVHGIHFLHQFIEHLLPSTGVFASFGATLLDGIVGFLVGLVLLLIVVGLKKLKTKP